MSFIEHLEELRSRIIKCVITVFVFSCISYLFVKQILAYAVKPVGKFVFLSPQEAFFSYLILTLFMGLFLSSPIIIFQIWRFVCAGLLRHERKYLLIYGPISFILFVGGMTFAFFLILPIGVRFLLSFGTDFLQPMISISRYISFAGMLLLGFGIVFQLPLAILFLTQVGLVSTLALRRNRKYAILLTFIISAILTPPDVLSQILMALPILLLLEISIWVAVLVEHKRVKRKIESTKRFILSFFL
ncbi:MAG: twin-arginine translocase subunit TatC [bacterium]